MRPAWPARRCLLLAVLGVGLTRHLAAAPLSPVLLSAQQSLDECLKAECLGHHECSHNDQDALSEALREFLFNLVTQGFTGPKPPFPVALLHDSLHRFLRHNETAVRRVDSRAVPAPIRGWPKLGLAWTLLGSMTYFDANCGLTTGGAGKRDHLCESLGRPHLGPPWEMGSTLWRDTVESATRGVCGVGYGVGKTGKEYHARLMNELPMRRADLARWVLRLVRGEDSHRQVHLFPDVNTPVVRHLESTQTTGTPPGAGPFFDSDVRGSVQVVSVERADAVGATGAYCRRPGRLPSYSGSSPGSSREALVVAFGDAKLCAHLIASAKRAGVAVRLLRYEASAGHRQMVEKLLALFRSLPSEQLVVKLDGSDVVLARDAGGERGLHERWQSLGGGVVFSAEAALFFHLGPNKVDCESVARYPESPTVYRFLNSGGYAGSAGDLARVLEAALRLVEGSWTSKDDQSVYANYFTHSSYLAHSGHSGGPSAPLIELDYCQDMFAVLSGPAATAQFSVLKIRRVDGGFVHAVTGTRPLVAHLPGRGKRFADFVKLLGGDPAYSAEAAPGGASDGARQRRARKGRGYYTSS